ncbi:MAG: hypothetical protein ACLFV3_08085 [Phycisphaeraceae bacterium]
MLRDPRSTIILTGYQSPNTLGGKLWQLAHEVEGSEEITQLDVGGTTIPREAVQARIVDLGPYFSSHADAGRLLDYLFTDGGRGDQSRPCTVFLNHGNNRARKALGEAVRQRAEEARPNDRSVEEVLLPSSSAWYDLDRNEWVKDELPGILPGSPGLDPRLFPLLERFVTAHERIAAALETVAGGSAELPSKPEAAANGDANGDVTAADSSRRENS